METSNIEQAVKIIDELLNKATQSGAFNLNEAGAANWAIETVIGELNRQHEAQHPAGGSLTKEEAEVVSEKISSTLKDGGLKHK